MAKPARQATSPSRLLFCRTSQPGQEGQAPVPLSIQTLREELADQLDKQADRLVDLLRGELRTACPQASPRHMDSERSDSADAPSSCMALASAPRRSSRARPGHDHQHPRQTAVWEPHMWLTRHPAYLAKMDSMAESTTGKMHRAWGTYPERRPHSVCRNSSKGTDNSGEGANAVPMESDGDEPGVAEEAMAEEIGLTRAPNSRRGPDAKTLIMKGYLEPLRSEETDGLGDSVLGNRKDKTVLRGFSWKNIVESHYFEYLCGLFVILNAISLGIETNYEVTHHVEHIPHWLQQSEAMFCVLFTLEQVLRLRVHGRRFFTMKGWPWNIFDLCVVGLQLLEEVSHVLTAVRIKMDISIIRTCRLLRLVRITRLIRVVRLFQDLRTLVASITASMQSLGCTLLLLAMVIYTYSILFTQIVLDALEANAPHAQALERWFGSLGRTALTLLESILGGVSWDEVVHPIYSDISCTAAILFCSYVAFCVFALMNVVTGVFVEKAMQTAQEHQDTYLANRISDLFFSAVNDAEDVTWEIFETRMNATEMREYFKAINVDPSEAYGLFQLLDVDGSGGVDCEEIVNGLLRLRGSARALELSLLMKETNRIHEILLQNITDFDRRLESLAKTLHKKSAQDQSTEFH